MEPDTKFESWAIVDLFGHTRRAGKVSEQTIGGCSFVRIDVPGETPEAFTTELYGNGAIYGIRIVSEEVARLAAQDCKAEPISMWSLPSPVRDALRAHQNQLELTITDDEEEKDEPDFCDPTY